MNHAARTFHPLRLSVAPSDRFEDLARDAPKNSKQKSKGSHKPRNPNVRHASNKCTHKGIAVAIQVR